MKFIRDIINEKRNASHAHTSAEPEAMLETQDQQSEPLDLGAYLQNAGDAGENHVPADDSSASDEGHDDTAYDDQSYDDEGYDTEDQDNGACEDESYDEEYEDDHTDDDLLSENLTGDAGEAHRGDHPMDALFDKQPGQETATDESAQTAPFAEDDAAAFFAGAHTAADETEDEADMMENDMQDDNDDTTSPASISELRRAIASERGAHHREFAREESVAEAAPGSPFRMPAPAPGRGSSRSGRVKTRLLGFTPGTEETDDPMARAEKSGLNEFAVGWVVVIDGPGRGSSFTLYDGVSKIGRGSSQAVSLNFGDNAISRDNHVSIAYDGEMNQFFIGHSGKANLVRVNNKPLLSTEEIRTGDTIRVGETTLRLIALCGEDFSWSASAEKDAKYA